MTTSKICLNCGTANESKFCSECGQSKNTHRLTVRHILHEIVHYFTHADKGIIFLIKELFIRPGTVINEYIEGKRKKYFNPFTYLILCSTISAYIYWKLQYYTSMNVPEAQQNNPPEMQKLLMQTSELMEKYGKIITIFMLPLLASLSKLFYFKKKHNFAEHLTIQAFILAQTGIMNIFITLTSYYIFPNSYFQFNMIFQVAFLIYMSFVFSKLYEENFLLSIVKSLGFILLFIILYWVIALGTVSIYNKFS